MNVLLSAITRQAEGRRFSGESKLVSLSKRTWSALVGNELSGGGDNAKCITTLIWIISSWRRLLAKKLESKAETPTSWMPNNSLPLSSHRGTRWLALGNHSFDSKGVDSRMGCVSKCYPVFGNRATSNRSASESPKVHQKYRKAKIQKSASIGDELLHWKCSWIMEKD